MSRLDAKLLGVEVATKDNISDAALFNTIAQAGSSTLRIDISNFVIEHSELTPSASYVSLACQTVSDVFASLRRPQVNK